MNFMLVMFIDSIPKAQIHERKGKVYKEVCLDLVKMMNCYSEKHCTGLNMFPKIQVWEN